MWTLLPHRVQRFLQGAAHLLQQHVSAWTRPARPTLVRGVTADLARGKAELVAENALLRQQLIVLQ